jgi:hypothetical protein
MNAEELCGLFERVEQLGVHNLNLVTGTQFVPAILRALELANPAIPVAWNTSGYETPETVRALSRYVSVFLPDMKYILAGPAHRYSYAGDYPAAAKKAIETMVECAGPYELDENGDVIYLQTGKNVVAYDTKNGKTMKATDGTLRVDEDGNPIYFLEDGSIAYDTVNGEPAGVDADADGYVDSKQLSKEEIANIKENASKLQGLIEAGDFSTFEAYGAQYAGDDGVWDAYPDGIFLNSEQEYSLAYLQELADQLQVAQVGDVILYESANALHLVMKYELTENAWREESNKDWFGTFEDEVIESVISSLCAEYADEIVIDQEALAKATGIKEIGANWNY